MIVTEATRKAELFRQTGCVALDMESGVVAEMAAARRVPFAVMRVVCDPADRTLPPAAVVALRPDGSLAVGALARSILCNPLQIPALIRVGRDAGRRAVPRARCWRAALAESPARVQAETYDTRMWYACPFRPVPAPGERAERGDMFLSNDMI
ncbi:hypothetical protein RAA17_02250 [Komagataeibacter rhaeticus]|nr:hypothetical protein [Komagataeibacter rhaeticus]